MPAVASKVISNMFGGDGSAGEIFACARSAFQIAMPAAAVASLSICQRPNMFSGATFAVHSTTFGSVGSGGGGGGGGGGEAEPSFAGRISVSLSRGPGGVDTYWSGLSTI